MSAPRRLSIGAQVLATDGSCGELTRVIVDPVAQTLTHLVVAPKHHQALGRLVPVELSEAGAQADPIRLRCTTAQFQALDAAEEIMFLPVNSDVFGYGPGQALSWPYYGLGLSSGMGAGGMGGGGMSLHSSPRPILSDRVPAGEMQVRRGDQVHAADGWIGSVQGLVIDPADHRMTHVLLQEGHFWGRRQVAIPIEAISRVDDAIQVRQTRQQVQDLPPLDLSSSP